MHPIKFLFGGSQFHPKAKKSKFLRRNKKIESFCRETSNRFSNGEFRFVEVQMRKWNNQNLNQEEKLALTASFCGSVTLFWQPWLLWWWRTNCVLSSCNLYVMNLWYWITSFVFIFKLAIVWIMKCALSSRQFVLMSMYKVCCTSCKLMI